MALRTGSVTARLATSATLNPSSVPANNFSTETFTVKGLQTDMCLDVNAPSLETGLVLVNKFVSAADTLKMTFWNTTNAAIDPASQEFRVVAF